MTIPNITSDTLSLLGRESGRWLVQSETSAYVIDLDTMTGVRVPGDGAGSVTAPEDVSVSNLRKDGQEFQIVTILSCAVGGPMVLFARGISDEPGVDTIRRTTIVQSITSIG